MRKPIIWGDNTYPNKGFFHQQQQPQQTWQMKNRVASKSRHYESGRGLIVITLWRAETLKIMRITTLSGVERHPKHHPPTFIFLPWLFIISRFSLMTFWASLTVPLKLWHEIPGIFFKPLNRCQFQPYWWAKWSWKITIQSLTRTSVAGWTGINIKEIFKKAESE